MLRTFQLDEIVLGVVDVDGYPFAFRPEAGPDLSDARRFCVEMFGNLSDVEWVHPQADVIHVARFLPGCGATDSSELSVDRYQVDHGTACPEMHEPKLGASPLHSAAQHRTIEIDHRLEIADAQDNVVDVTDVEHVTAALIHL